MTIDAAPPSPAARLIAVTRRLIALLLGVLVLSACRLDVVVTVEMEPDGTGLVTVVAVADADLVSRVPDLVDDLRLADAEANGWIVEGPVADDEGNLSITLSHTFASATELANVLNSIGPPLGDAAGQVAAARTFDPSSEQTTNAVRGTLVLPNGFETFADADLVAAVGGLPFGEDIAATGLTPADAMSFTYRVALPGELISSDGVQVDGDTFEWKAPLDGSAASLDVQTVQRPPGSGNSWASPLATLALILLIAWVIASAAFIGFVAIARNNKRRRREQALSRLDR